MVVTSRNFGLGASGTIDVTALDAALTITRVESLGQAVRNLVELGAIELLGRHANVPYWECLNIPAVKQRRTNRKEIVFSSADKPLRISEVQKMLQTLGYYSGEIAGTVDQRTRDAISHFQAGHGLIATGDLNYDTYQQLLEKTKGFAPKRSTALPPKHEAQSDVPEETKGEYVYEIDSNIVPALKPLPRAPLFSGIFSKQKRQKSTLDIQSSRQSYDTGDHWQTYLIAPHDGSLSCFHQSDNDLIAQIFPMQPNTAFEISKGEKVLIPDPRDGFAIQFERKGASEKIMCILADAETPASISSIRAKRALGPMNVLDFKHLIESYRAVNPEIIWGEIAKKVSGI